MDTVELIKVLNELGTVGNRRVIIAANGGEYFAIEDLEVDDDGDLVIWAGENL